MTASSGPELRVLSAGPGSTIQDAGRHGYLRYGVTGAGPMDPLAHATANRALGNDAGLAAIEVSLGGIEVTTEERPVTVAVVGGGFAIALDGQALPPAVTMTVEPGAKLRVRAGNSGAWCYLAVAGGFDLPQVLGSVSTHNVIGDAQHERPALMLDPWLTSSHRAVRAITANLIGAHEDQTEGTRQRRRKDRDRENFAAVTTAIVANLALAVASQLDPPTVGVSLRAARRSSTRYERPGFTALPKVLEVLGGGELFTLSKSSRKGVASAITAGPFFAEALGRFNWRGDHFGEAPGREPAPDARPLKEEVADIMALEEYRKAPDGSHKLKGTKLWMVYRVIDKYRDAAARQIRGDENVREALMEDRVAVADHYTNGGPPKNAGGKLMEQLGPVGKAFGINLGPAK